MELSTLTEKSRGGPEGTERNTKDYRVFHLRIRDSILTVFKRGDKDWVTEFTRFNGDSSH